MNKKIITKSMAVLSGVMLLSGAGLDVVAQSEGLDPVVEETTTDFEVISEGEIEFGIVEEMEVSAPVEETTEETVDPEPEPEPDPEPEETTVEETESEGEFSTAIDVQREEGTNPFKTIYSPDSELPFQEQKVVQEGKDGHFIKTITTTTTTHWKNDEIVDQTEDIQEDIEQDTPAVDQLVNVGNMTQKEEEIQFEVIYRENPELDEGVEQVVQEGIVGKNMITTTYEVNPGTGELHSPVENKEVVVAKQDKIIEVGTKVAEKEKSIESSDIVEVEKGVIPFKTIYSPDSELPFQEQEVIQEGKQGTKTITTTITITNYLEDGVVVDTQEDKKVDEQETPAVDQLVNIGNVTKNNEEIQFEVIYRHNPDLYEGQEIVVQEGVVGKNIITTTYEVNPETGELENPKEDRKVEVEKQDKIIEVGDKEIPEAEPKPCETSTVQDKDIPFETVYSPEPELPFQEQEVIQEGVVGKVEHTITKNYKGEITESSKVLVKKEDKLINVGNMIQKEEEIPFETIYRLNPELEEGEEKVIQEGVVGKNMITTTYEVNPKTGELENPKEDRKVEVEKQDKIIEIGTKKEEEKPEEKPEEPTEEPKEVVKETPQTPEQPQAPSQPAPSQPEQEFMLPDTGEVSGMSALVGSMASALGGLFLMFKKRK